jgi:hypothetical protein
MVCIGYSHVDLHCVLALAVCTQRGPNVSGQSVGIAPHLGRTCKIGLRHALIWVSGPGSRYGESSIASRGSKPQSVVNARTQALVEKRFNHFIGHPDAKSPPQRCSKYNGYWALMPHLTTPMTLIYMSIRKKEERPEAMAHIMGTRQFSQAWPTHGSAQLA